MSRTKTRMYRQIASLIILAGVMFSWQPLRAQWMQTAGPGGGQVNCLAVLGSSIFAGTQTAGVFRSTDFGVTLRAANNGMVSLPIVSLASSGSNILAASGRAVYPSTDNGDDWNVVVTDLVADGMESLAVSGEIVYAASYVEVWVSSDHGLDWTPIDETGQGIRSLAAIDTNIFIGGEQGGVWRWTTNTGWAQSGLGTSAVWTLLAAGNDLYAGLYYDGGLFHSSDLGQTWFPAENGLTNLNVTALASLGNTLFVGTGTGIFVSKDSAINWTQIDTFYANSITFLGSRNITGNGDGSGVSVSTNGGATWQQFNQGLSASTVNAMISYNNALFAGTDADGLFRSTDGGASWVQTDSVIAGSQTIAFASIDSSLFVTSYPDGLFLSKDGGASWNLASSDSSIKYAILLTASGPNLIAAIWGGLLISSDGGLTWESTLNNDQGTSAFTSANGIIMAAANNGASPGGEMFRSTDNGLSWTQVTNPRPFVGYVYGLAQIGNILFAGMRDAPFDGNLGRAVYLSTDSGNSWREVKNGLKDSAINCLYSIGSNLFAGTLKGSIYLTTNLGSSWTNVSTGLSSGAIQCLCFKDSFLYAGTEAGVWKRSLPELLSSSSVAAQTAAADITSYASSSPNPTGEGTVITFGLSQEAYVKIGLFDILGHEVQSQAGSTGPRERLFQPGNHEVPLSLQGLPSGTYYARILTTFGSVATVKLVKE